jgi:two-component system cell cycle response regulator
MEQVTSETWVTPPRRPTSTSRNACLVHIYPTGSHMGRRYPIGESSLIVGRGDDCDLRIQDHSVSRKHARIEPTDTGVYVADLVSTNGTFINDRLIDGRLVLHDGDYLRVGNCIYRFLAGGNVESEYHEEIYRLTIIDALTQIHNQRYMIEFLDRELIRSARHSRPLAFLLFDIDLFKSVNDQFGHLAGDFTLRELSACVRSTVRREDLFARYGGEEFGVVLVETPPTEAMEVAERIRQTVGNHTFRFEDKSFGVTVSIGVVCTTGDDSLLTKDIIQIADQRMYEAKHAGRNRVVG